MSALVAWEHDDAQMRDSYAEFVWYHHQFFSYPLCTFSAKELLEFGILGLVSVTGCQAAEILMYPVAAWGLRHAIVTTNGCALSRERSPIAYVLRPDAELILDVFYDIMERAHARYVMVKEITLFYDDSLGKLLTN